MTPRCALLLLATLLASSHASGAIVELKNGDRLTGTVLRQDDETLYMKSDLFGPMEIPTAKVARIVETPTPPQATAATTPAPAPVTAANTPSRPVSGAAKSVVPQKPKGLLGMTEGGRYLIDVAKSFLREKGILGKWKSSIRFGYALSSGEASSSNASAALHTERQWKVNSVRFDYQQDYATSTDAAGKETLTRDKLKLDLQYRHSLSQRNFLQTDTQYSYAHVTGIKNDYLQSFGYGWKCFDTKTLKVSLTPSLAFHYQELDTADTGMSIAPTLYEEVDYRWTEFVKIHSEAYAMFPANGKGDPTYHFSTILQNRIVGNLALNLEYQFDYDGSVSATSQSSQHVLRTAFSFDF